jgi:hypothetical protein
MIRIKALASTAAALGVLAVAVPTAGAATLPFPTAAPAGGNICLTGFVDPGPLGPNGPYGASGPWGPNGPMYGQKNPLGNTAQCGGALAFILNGGTLTSFVNANLAAFGH